MPRVPDESQGQVHLGQTGTLALRVSGGVLRAASCVVYGQRYAFTLRLVLVRTDSALAGLLHLARAPRPRSSATRSGLRAVRGSSKTARLGIVDLAVLLPDGLGLHLQNVADLGPAQPLLSSPHDHGSLYLCGHLGEPDAGR